MLVLMVFDINNHTLKMSQVPFDGEELDVEGQMLDVTSLFVALFHENEAAAEALIAATASAGALDVQVEREGVGRGLREVGGPADARGCACAGRGQRTKTFSAFDGLCSREDGHCREDASCGRQGRAD